MVTLVKIRREPTGARYVFGRRFDQVVGEPGRLIGDGITIEFGPARVMVRNHVFYEILRLYSVEVTIAKCANKLSGECGVFVHHDCEMRFPWLRSLNDHSQPSSDKYIR
jgi:hypothetical protein